MHHSHNSREWQNANGQCAQHNGLWRARVGSLSAGITTFVGEMLTTPSQDSPGVGECSDLTRVRLLRPVAAPSSEPHMWGLSAGIPLQSHL